MRSLSEVTQQLGEAYDGWKKREKEKNKFKDEFFSAVSQEIQKEPLAQFVERVPAKTEEQAQALAERRWPHLSVDALHPDDEGNYVVILKENPEYRSFTYVNPEDGRVYSRQVVEGGPILDDESLQEAEPELWEAITEEITKREMKPMDQLTPAQIEALKPYVYAGKPTIKLAAPRKAKPEELDVL